MPLKEIIFIGIMAVVVLGAFLAVWPRNVFHNALGLGLCLFGVAGIFIYLNAEFLAVMEIIIYIGAITIAIIFAIMLSQTMTPKQAPRNPKKVAQSFVLAGLIFFVLSKTIRMAHWPFQTQSGDYSIKAIGKSLLTTYALPFETVSLVLLVAIIGALLISEPEGKSK